MKPVPTNINDTFKGIFFVLYDIPQEKFAWEDFKKKAYDIINIFQFII